MHSALRVAANPEFRNTATPALHAIEALDRPFITPELARLWLFGVAAMAAPLLKDNRQWHRTLSGASISWDYFTSPEGTKRGFIRDLSPKGMMICTNTEMSERRWLRIIVRHPQESAAKVVRGRVVHQRPALDSWPDEQLTLFRQGVELLDELPQDWVAALSDERLGSCECGALVTASQNTKKPAALLDQFEGSCGLCQLRSVVATSRP